MIDDDAPEDHEQLKELAAEMNRPLTSLIALNWTNDPWLAGAPSRLAAAEWVAELFHRLDFPVGTHGRRIHYRLVSQPTPVLMVSGEPYENTLNCSQSLYNSARDARYLDLIPANTIVDHRNPAPVICLVFEPESPAEVFTGDGSVGAVTGLSYHGANLALPSMTVTSPTISQRYHIEIWCEKSTMNDIILPLGPEFSINIVTGIGEMSSTQCEDLVDRVKALGRPTRILYVSDFDPAGLSMPLAVARKIEFLVRKSGLEFDIQIRNVVLTHEQCVEYELPRTPLKETEKRGPKFEERFGEGATELDALEAIHPGELRRILVTEIERYYDADLADNIEAVVSEIEDDIDQIESEISDQHADEIAELAKEREELNAEGSKEIEKVRQLMAPKEAAYQERAQRVLVAITDDLEAAAPDADSYEWPEPAEGDEDLDPLFDSTRSYMEQMDRYREHQDKPVEMTCREFETVCQNPKCGKTFISGKKNAVACGRKCRRALGFG